MNPEWPSLAGQHTTYFIKQMHDYQQATTRNNAIMSAIVAGLSEEDFRDLANFYQSLPRPKAQTKEKTLDRGEAIYKRGDMHSHITACIACHGPDGTGNAQAGFPLIAGQQTVYTTQQLQAFKHKTRSNDLNAIMRNISGNMSDDDMTAVARYINSLAH